MMREIWRAPNGVRRRGHRRADNDMQRSVFDIATATRRLTTRIMAARAQRRARRYAGSTIVVRAFIIAAVAVAVAALTATTRTAAAATVAAAAAATTTTTTTTTTTATGTEAGADKTIVCSGAVPYRGSARHPAVTVPDVSGALDGAFDAATVARLQQAVEAARTATAAPSLTAAVAVPGTGFWTTESSAPAAAAAAAADARATGGDTAPAPLHYWASAGKTFIAVAILQLMDEGKLRLEDPVSRWIADVPNGDAITVEQLLTHTSGLFSANEDLQVRKHPRVMTPAETLAVAKKHGPLFCPGENWRYSNTGYDLLGEIIRKVDGRSYPEALTARIIAPLKLTRMRVLNPADRSPAAIADVPPMPSKKPEAYSQPLDPRWPGAAGAIVASSGDMVRVWQALLGYRLLKPETTRRMFATLYPMFTPVEFYGLGVMVYEVPQPDGSTRTWLGHAGGAPGVGAVVVYSPADRAFAAVALTGDGSAQATVNLLLRQLHAGAEPAPAAR